MCASLHMKMATHRSSHENGGARSLTTAMSAAAATSPLVVVPDHSLSSNDDASFFRNGKRHRKPLCEEQFGLFSIFCQRRRVGVTSKFHMLLSYALGVLCGGFLTLFIQHFALLDPHRIHPAATLPALSNSIAHTVQQVPSTTTFTFLSDVPSIESRSHVGIGKQSLLLRPFQVHPDLIGISVATIWPGQAVTMHVHETMHEFFFIYQGEVEITVQASPSKHPDDPNKLETTTPCGSECFVHAVPGEAHAFAVRSDSIVEVKLFIVQLAVPATRDGS